MVSTRSSALSCIAVLALLVACGGDSAPERVQTPDASTPVTCNNAGESLCGEVCVNTATHSAHCGRCGNACTSTEACEGGVCVARCQIDNQSVASGALNPANACEQCTPTTSTTTWSQRADGTQCGTGQVCSAGACSQKCFIGGALYDAGTANPANACEQCTPTTSATTWSQRADGAQCGTGQVCSAGACSQKCFIGGALYDVGTANPANACEQCTPTTSATTWSQQADGAQCGTGQVCSAGACSQKCFIGDALYDVGTANPANACESCQPATSTTQWSARASVPLLVGGQDIIAQGWKVFTQAPQTLTNGPDYVRLATSTNPGGRTSGQLLISLADAVDATKPFKLRVTMLVESVSTHNTLDSAAAILGSFTPPVGNGTDRAQMIYLDSAKIGWSDDTQSAAFPVTDGAYHVYELAVDAAKVATVSIDGVARLTRNNFTTTGTIAIGDQTNDANYDGVMRIKSVERLCQ